MDKAEFFAVLDLMRMTPSNPDTDNATFITNKTSYRGRIKKIYNKSPTPPCLLIECFDIHDTSGAGNDFVAIPLSELVGMYHDAKSHRLERNSRK